MDGVSVSGSSIIHQAFTSIGEDRSQPPGKKARVGVDISCHINTHTVYAVPATITQKCCAFFVNYRLQIIKVNSMLNPEGCPLSVLPFCLFILLGCFNIFTTHSRMFICTQYICPLLQRVVKIYTQQHLWQSRMFVHTLGSSRGPYLFTT